MPHSDDAALDRGHPPIYLETLAALLIEDPLADVPRTPVRAAGSSARPHVAARPGDAPALAWLHDLFPSHTDRSSR